MPTWDGERHISRGMRWRIDDRTTELCRLEDNAGRPLGNVGEGQRHGVDVQLPGTWARTDPFADLD